MTMLSFRVDERDAEKIRGWAETLGVDRSELLRDALRRQLDRLAAEHDPDRWQAQPLDDREFALSEIADWGPDEDWSDWLEPMNLAPASLESMNGGASDATR